MNTPRSIAGLYGITPDWQDTSKLLTAIQEAAKGGMTSLQFRRKTGDLLARHEQARACQALCKTLDITFIINDDWQLAEAIQADGVHLGSDDGDIAYVRQRNPKMIIGASCYNQLTLAIESIQLGANYIAFGALFNSTTKPHAPVAPLTLFKELHQHFATTNQVYESVGIGGINTDNAEQVYQAGADSIAVINALFDQANIRSQALSFSRAQKHK